MEKPQIKYEQINPDYSQRVSQSYDLASRDMDRITTEYLDELIDRVYMEAYLDGFQYALFFMGRK